MIASRYFRPECETLVLIVDGRTVSSTDRFTLFSYRWLSLGEAVCRNFPYEYRVPSLMYNGTGGSGDLCVSLHVSLRVVLHNARYQPKWTGVHQEGAETPEKSRVSLDC